MKIRIIKGDITDIRCDCIVNAANSSLMGGGGVDGAIHAKAGERLLEECKMIRKKYYPTGLPTGKAVITNAFKLPARYVIHTVGPIYSKDDIDLLKDCYLNSLDLASKFRCKSILFPAISTGVYGVPIELSAKIVNEILSSYSSDMIAQIGLVLYSDFDYSIYKKEFMDLAE